VLQPRDNLEFSVLATASGLAVVPHADDLAVATSSSRVVIGRPAGLALTPQTPQAAGSPALLAGGHDGPSFLNLAAWKRGPGKTFLDTERFLRAQVAMQDPDNANAARLHLARFYLANDFAAEALGIVRQIQTADPSLRSHPQLLVMRAAAEYRMGRYRDAHNDLTGDGFTGDRHAAFWRVLTESALHNWSAARDATPLAEAVVNRYPVEWQTRLRLAEADAALATGHIEVADSAVARLPQTLPDSQLLDGELMRARLYAQEGRYRDATVLFAEVEHGKNASDAAQAVYWRTDAALAAGAMTREQGIDALEKLRFRWRGDFLELAILRKLGQLYFAKQDWRDGLRVLKLASQSFPDDDGGRQAQDDMRNAFENLYIKGKANKIPPIQALALFYDYIDLTPIGPNGDEMIRRMSDRLVAVDLLGPAADLLKYQVNRRLDGIARAQVAARLAMVYLMDKKPEDALSTLVGTRIAELPDDVNHQRMLLEARALAGLKRWDQALDMVAVDETPDARRLRADIYWESGNWPVAGQKSEELLGASFADAAPLSAEERNDVMRAAVAYSLANDQPSLDRIRTNFLPKMKASPDASAFAVVTQRIDAHGLAFRDAAAEIASIDSLKTFLADFRKGGS
jgi:tetratricopeptide (TPR) repeat protein